MTAPLDLEPPTGRFDDDDLVEPEPSMSTGARMRIAATDGLPVIRICPRLHENVDASVVALRDDEHLYQRDGSLVHVTQTIDDGEGARIQRGTPIVRALATSTLRERLTRVAAYEKYDARAKRWVATLPSGPIVEAVHARGEWRGIRPIVGVIETPSMRPDGSLIVDPGYDAATAYLYAPSCSFPRVPEHPTQAEAARALADLCEVFCDFQFASEAARYVPVAATMTIIVRPAVRGAVPAFVCDAPTPGTGKSLCSDAICTIATGRAAPRGAFPSNPEELEKVLGAYALASASIIGFDDVPGAFGGASLDRCLTASDTVDLRVLGRSEIRSMVWRATVLASANNIQIVGATQRRALVARIESAMERPEDRTGFRHGEGAELLEWIASERPRLVVAALTVVRAFVVAGRPSTCKVLGSFEAWARLIPAAIVFAGGANVLDARVSEDAGDDGERAAVSSLLRGWARLDAQGAGLTAREAVHLLYPGERDAGPPDGHDDLRDAIETLARGATGRTPDANRLGHVLRRYRARIVGGHRLVSAPDRKGAQRWKVEAT